MPSVPEPFETRPGGQPGGPDAAAVWEALREGLGAAAEHGDGMRCVELCPICRTADILRGGGSTELRGQINDFQREALLTVRALLDHYLDRLDESEPPAERVEEIPID